MFVFFKCSLNKTAAILILELDEAPRLSFNIGALPLKMKDCFKKQTCVLVSDLGSKTMDFLTLNI